MAYGQRDRFLQAIVIFTTSDKAKEMSLGDRQRLLLDIRDKYAPDISNDIWTELANGVNEFKFVVTDAVRTSEVPTIEKLLPKIDKPLQKENTDDDDNMDLDDEDGVTEEPDYTDPEPLPEPKPVTEPERFGKFLKEPKKQKSTKINTSALRGLLKQKKKDDEPETGTE